MSIRLGNNIVAGRSAYQPSLFDFKWADHALNDPSWVRADTYNWLYEAAYDVAYDHLVSDITGKTLQSETIAGITITFYLAADGHKICMFNQNDILQALYDTTGIAWYYILDINNHRFKLPRTKWGFTGIRNQTSVGSYIAAGLPNITGKFGVMIPDYHSEKCSGAFRGVTIDNNSHFSWTTGSTDLTCYGYDINASRSSSVYGNSTTVQPQATQMYLYFYLGSFNEQALENAADLSINELEEFLDDRVATKQDIATAVNYDNITNCITEIPQDIKLELNNGTLTLKAGSKVWLPNGVGVFDKITIANDLTVTDTGNRTLWVGVHANGAILIKCVGSETGSPVAGTYKYYYDLTANKCYQSAAGSTPQASFPIAIIKSSTTGITSIEKVFNGFGYVGSTVYALPGVKGLIPNGRNADGTLKNISFTINEVHTATFSGTTDYTTLILSGDGWIGESTSYSYAEDINYNIWDGDKTDIQHGVLFGSCSLSSGKISNFSTKTVFHAVDYNEADFVVSFQRPTAENNYTWYRKYKSGWVEQGGQGVAGSGITYVTLPVQMANIAYTATGAIIYSGTQEGTVGFQFIKQTNRLGIGGRYNGIFNDGLAVDWQVSGMAA